MHIFTLFYLILNCEWSQQAIDSTMVNDFNGAIRKIIFEIPSKELNSIA